MVGDRCFEAHRAITFHAVERLYVRSGYVERVGSVPHISQELQGHLERASVFERRILQQPCSWRACHSQALEERYGSMFREHDVSTNWTVHLPIYHPCVSDTVEKEAYELHKDDTDEDVHQEQRWNAAGNGQAIQIVSH